MLTKITALDKLPGFRLAMRFNDDSSGVHDFGKMVEEVGPMIESLSELAYFHQVNLDHGALVWPNGFDIDPEWLRREMDMAGELQKSAAAE